MMKMQLKNYASEVDDDQSRSSRWYRWKVFVDAPPEVLDSIEEVKYTLHPTFPDPVQTRKDKSKKFALESSGWGEFTVQADVEFRDGHKETLTHWLNLSASWPKDDDTADSDS